ncbi:MAG: hypothetical protein LBI78_04895 [Campylobacteraceae bacterium]|jgi:hypothetical protein|nr:hypothetical protein [Campylobacteraceae bacterium]
MRKIEPFEDDYIMEKSELIELIKTAFMSNKMPDDNDIVYDPLTADEGIEQVYSGKLWYELDYKFILENRNGIYFFSKNAFRYFIPAFMIATIEYFEETDDVSAVVVNIFTLPEKADTVKKFNSLKSYNNSIGYDEELMKELIKSTDGQREWFLERMSSFNDMQCKSVIKYLKYMEQYKDELYNDPKISYERYWRRYGYKGNGIFID